MSGGLKVAGELGQFVSGLTLASLPRRVTAAVKERLLDFACVALAGQTSSDVLPWLDYAQRLAGRCESTVVGRGIRSSAFGAALANGVSAAVLELDDGHIEGHVHPGVAVMPAVLALAEREDRSADDFLPAIVAGYEVAIRVGEALSPNAIYAHGINVSALAGSFGATAAAVRILGLDAEEAAYALGVAAATTPVAPMATFQQGATAKAAYGGWPAAIGVLAADLAAAGITGAAGIFEDRWGLAHTVADGGKPERFTDRLGERWAVLEAYTKLHASCSHAHTALDAALEAAGRTLDPSDVEGVEIETYTYAAALAEPAPHTATAAQFSIPYCIAVALVEGHVGPSEFRSDMLMNPGIRALAARVRVLEDRDLEDRHQHVAFCRPARVTIFLRDGSHRTAYREVAKGWPQAPLTTDELMAKYSFLARLAMPVSAAEQLAIAIHNITPTNDLALIWRLIGHTDSERVRRIPIQ